MPTKSKSESRMRSRSRSRSHSRGRSKSPSRTKATKMKQSPSPSRKPKPAAKTPTTPTRSSTRIKQLAVKQESPKIEEKVPKQRDSVQKDMKLETQPIEAKSSKYGLVGPIKVLMATIITVFFMMAFNLLCNKNSCSINFKKFPSIPTKLSAYFDCDAVLLFCAYYMFQLVLACIPVGRVVHRPAVKGGQSTSFRCNGLLALILSLLTLAGLIFFRFPVTMVHDKLIQLLATSAVLALIMTSYAYFGVRNLGDSDKNETGCTVYDHYMGRALYPRIGSLDVKHFFFSRCIITWGMLNAVFVWKAYSEGSLTATLALVAFFQGIYIADRLLFEDHLPFTFSYRELGYGYYIMAVSIMIPFTCSLQCRFLLEHPTTWHNGCLAGFFILNFIGYVIYQGSNSEKNKFRQDPHNPMFASFKKIPSSSGKKLLASGWWGLCRHPNYLGDLIMAISWVLPLGLQHGYLASLYPVILLPVLMGQAWQDNVSCQQKHGAAWERYCREVKYTIVPYVY